ncbi:MAG TPA: hypothetical protein V6C58_10875, partial [Allocoleopsis sp.]
PPPDYQAPTIIFEADCSISVTYGINPAFKINTKIEEVNGIVKITTKTIRLADNVTTTEYLHIKDNDYYIPYSPFPDYNDPNTYTAKLEYETYHITNGIRVSRDYYTMEEAKEKFMSKEEFFQGIGAGLGTNVGISIALYMLQYYFTEKAIKDFFPLEINLKLNTVHGNQQAYTNYDNLCKKLWQNKKTYFNETNTSLVRIVSQNYTPYPDRIPPLLFCSIEPSRGLVGDRGLDAGETQRPDPTYIPPDALKP